MSCDAEYGDEEDECSADSECVWIEDWDSCEETCDDRDEDDCHDPCAWRGDSCSLSCEYKYGDDEDDCAADSECVWIEDWDSCQETCDDRDEDSCDDYCEWSGDTCSMSCEYKYGDDEDDCAADSECVWIEDWDRCYDTCDDRDEDSCDDHCTSFWNDCCASMDWGEPATCVEGYYPVPAYPPESSCSYACCATVPDGYDYEEPEDCSAKHGRLQGSCDADDDCVFIWDEDSCTGACAWKDGDCRSCGGDDCYGCADEEACNSCGTHEYTWGWVTYGSWDEDDGCNTNWYYRDWEHDDDDDDGGGSSLGALVGAAVGGIFATALSVAFASSVNSMRDICAIGPTIGMGFNEAGTYFIGPQLCSIGGTHYKSKRVVHANSAKGACREFCAEAELKFSSVELFTCYCSK
ncbi:hypothetical protein SO694_00009359 [Aureococcus anophagefferens]|uniref:LNR domain-containing protein n=1 Tax=Aureococcus anophagefferens TaxID=44056 RepID=A0ABR1GDZ5_AURAN